MQGRVREIFLIHHSHTDIGYTAQQSTVASWQAEFLRQALETIKTRPEFRWTCETFWGVEQFLIRANPNERRAFAQAVTNGQIGLSGSYLNFNELLDYDNLKSVTSRAGKYGSQVGIKVDSAMTADINGFGHGFAQALHDSGVQNLLTCIHTHHGMYPLGRRHIAFWWETPSGDRILVFNAEHYHYGNELGLVAGAVSSYTIKDECDATMIFGDHWKVAEIRIPRFIDQLEESGYPHDIVPLMASGLRTDNGPPNEAILDTIDRWNDTHGDVVRIRMATLSEFFGSLRSDRLDCPTYRGDWPDWWSDGLASVPADTALFRQAQRNLAEIRLLGQIAKSKTDKAATDIEQNLALYAEHTFSHADSVSCPWGLDVKGIAARKATYAALAYDDSEAELGRLEKVLGGASLRPNRPLHYRVVNGCGHELTDYAQLVVGHYEFNELGLDKGVRILDRATGQTLAHQMTPTSGGAACVVRLTLQLGEMRELEILPDPGGRLEEYQPRPSDRLETPTVSITWSAPGGITSWADPRTETELIRPDTAIGPLSPIHEVTPATSDTVCLVRSAMGLNRKGEGVRRSLGQLAEGRMIADGPLSCVAELAYDLPGCGYYRQQLTAYKHDARVDLSVRLGKNNDWQPENLYLALPFCPGPDPFVTWLDKTAAPMRPRIDQLPGTLTDFYCVQDGLFLLSATGGLVVATPDTPLVHMGDLEYRERKLHDVDHPGRNDDMLYSWMMTNYWETNFAAGLGGFYEFRYTIAWDKDWHYPRAGLNQCRAFNTGLRAFRVHV